jgi:hypothetical protein
MAVTKSKAAGKLALFQVDHFRRQTTTLETPLAEP